MIMLQINISNVLSVLNICCNYFHLSVAKVDIDVGLLSEEERASAGVMAASMWGRGASHTVPVWKTRGSQPSGVEEVGAKRCGRGGQGERS